MRRLARYVLTALTALSLLLFVAVTLAWPISYWRYFHVDKTYLYIRDEDGTIAERPISCTVEWGKVEISVQARQTYGLHDPELSPKELIPVAEAKLFPWTWSTGQPSPMGVGLPFPDSRATVIAFGGFQFERVCVTPETREFEEWEHARDTTTVVPLWWIFVVSAALPAVRLRSRLSRRAATRRSKQGRCPTCNYDLRATPDRCPECGTVVAQASRQ